MKKLDKRYYRKPLLKRASCKTSAAILYQSALGLLNRLEMNVLLELIVKRAANLLDTSNGYYNSVDLDRQLMVRKAGIGIYQDDINRTMGIQQGLIKQTLQTGKAAIIDDYSAWEERLHDPFFDKVRAEMQIPIIIDSVIVGVLGLSFTEAGRRFAGCDIALFEQFSTIAAIAIDNAMLYAMAKQEFEEREKTQAHLLDITENMHDIISKVNQEGIVEYITSSCEKATGHAAGALCGTYFWDYVHPDDRETIRETFFSFLTSGEPGVYCHRILSASGREIWLESVGERIFENGKVMGAVFASRDVTDRMQVQANYQAIFGLVNDGIVLYDLETLQVLEANNKVCEFLGLSKDEVLKMNAESLGSGEFPYDSSQIQTWFQKAIAGERPLFEWKIKNGQGRHVDVEVNLKQVNITNKSYIMAVVRDISDRRAATEKIYRLANYDALTGLPNKRLFEDRLSIALAHAKRNGEKLAVLYLDLDRFKTINDSLGHDTGDELLQKVAGRLQMCVRDDDTICHQGGDKFIILLTDIPKVSDLPQIIGKFHLALATPLISKETEIRLTSSIGVSCFPDNGHSPEILIRNSELAMYYAKDSGRNNHQFFTESLNEGIAERLSIESSLRLALERNEFLLYYQPQIDIRTNEFIGVEALIRWNHPQKGMISPAKFIPVAEETGMIIPIGEWVIHEVCRQHNIWLDMGLPAIQIALNLSAIQFRQKQFPTVIADIIKKYNVNPSYLEIELTEGIVMGDDDGAIEEMHALKKLGLNLSIDDFGTGYSSLRYLCQFPIDKLKIDQSFVREMNADSTQLAIIKTIITLARQLRLRVLAEGVESKEELEQLKKCGCEEVQGYYFSPPLPAGQFVEWFEKWKLQNI